MKTSFCRLTDVSIRSGRHVAVESGNPRGGFEDEPGDAAGSLMMMSDDYRD